MSKKELLLSVLLMISALIVFNAWADILDKPWLSLSILMYAVVFGFFLLLVRNKFLFWSVPQFTLIFSILFFEINEFLAMGIFFGAVILTYALWAHIEEDLFGVKILLRRVIGRSLGLFFTATALMLSFIYLGTIYYYPDPAKLLLSESVFEKTVEFWAPSLGIPNSEVKAISRAFYEHSMARIKDAAGEYEQVFPILAAASYFFALKAVSVIFYYLAIVSIYLLFKLSVMTGFVKKEIILAEKEIIE